MLTNSMHTSLPWFCFFLFNSPLGLRAPYQSRTIIKSSFLFFPFVFSSEKNKQTNETKILKKENTRAKLCRNLHGNATVMIIRGKGDGWIVRLRVGTELLFYVCRGEST